MISIRNNKFPNYHCKKNKNGGVSIYRDGSDTPLKPLSRYKKELVFKLFVNGEAHRVTLFEFLRQAFSKA